MIADLATVSHATAEQIAEQLRIDAFEVGPERGDVVVEIAAVLFAQSLRRVRA